MSIHYGQISVTLRSTIVGWNCTVGSAITDYGCKGTCKLFLLDFFDIFYDIFKVFLLIFVYCANSRLSPTQAILDTVDPNRDGVVSLQEYMAFMISQETENVTNVDEVILAFKALTTGGDKTYISENELYAVRQLRVKRRACNKYLWEGKLYFKIVQKKLKTLKYLNT